MDCTATSTSHINLGTGLYLPALYQMYYLPVNLVVFRGTQVSETRLSLRCQVRHRSKQPLTHEKLKLCAPCLCAAQDGCRMGLLLLD